MGPGLLVASVPAVQVWQLDPLEAVFRETAPVERQVAPYDVAKGEVAEWQVVVRVPDSATVSVSASEMKGLGLPRCRFIGYVDCNKPPTWPSPTQLKAPPASFPDPLLADASVRVDKDQSQAVWIDLPISKDAKPGLYKSTVTVTTTLGDTKVASKVPIEAKVYGVFVSKNRMKSTNWFFAWPQYWHVPTKKGQNEVDAQIDVLAKSLAAHRQNVGGADALGLSKFGIDKSGQMTVDFSEFDRRVKMLMKAGLIGTIEGGGMGTRNGWAQPNLGMVRVIEDGKVVAKVVPATDPAVDKFYSFFFPALLAHLKAKHWDKIYLQHVVDEPCDDNVDTYRALVEVARKYLPGIRLLDTCCGVKFAGLMDVYSPELDFLNENYDLFKSFQKSGKELWFYTCWKPQGTYANRLIEEPLIKTRLLTWISFKYGVTGYLHWGYDYWALNEANGSKKDQFTHDYSPGGDGWITYPGKGALLDSRRNESMRDGLADNEILWMLADKDPVAAHRIADEIVLAMDRYDLDIRAFRAARRELLTQLVVIQQSKR